MNVYDADFEWPKDTQIERHLLKPGDVPQVEPPQLVQGEQGHQDSAGPSHQAQEEALRHQLTNQARPPGPHGCPERDLVPPSGSAR